MANLMGHSFMCFVIINFSTQLTLSSSSSTSSTSTLPTTSTVKIETELVSSESKNNEDKNDLLKDLKDLGPDDLAKLIKAKKEKELDEFKSKITNIRGNREIVLEAYQPQQPQKGAPIVQQQEDDYQSQGDSSANEDDFDDGNDSSAGLTPNAEKGGKKPSFNNLGSLIPFLPNPGSVMTMMVKPIDHPEQMVCDCYNPGKTSTQQRPQQQLQITQQQQQLWPPMLPSNRKVPMIPPMAPMAPIQPMQPPISLFPPSPFSFIGQHFANKPMSSHKKKQLNPLSLLLMGLTGGKRKRPRPRPVYGNYPPYQQQQSIASVLPGFEPNEPEFMYPAQQIYNIKGNGGSKGGGARKGRKRPRNPYNNLPPPPSSIKGRTKNKGSDKGKWRWTTLDDYKDLTQGFN